MARKRDDDEDDYLDEEEDEIQEEAPRAKNKRKKRKISSLLDIEAEEDDAEDDEDDEEIKDLIAEDDDDVDDERQAHRAQRLQRQQQLEQENPEDYLKLIEQRYVDTHDDDDDDDQPAAGVDVDQQQFLPTFRDPRLFIVRIRKNGHEKRAALTLLQKYFDYRRKGRDLGILGAVAPDNVKGIIYVEAATSTSVEQAIAGLDIFNSYLGVKPLPIEEMPDVLKPQKRTDRLQRWDWVRVNKGLYKGDLAQVVDVGEQENSCRIRLIPRLDLRSERELLNEDDFEYGDDANNSRGILGAKKRGRPPQKLFDKEEIYRLTSSTDMHAERDRVTGEIFDVWNNQYYRHGLVYQKPSVKSLIRGDDVQPQVSEIEKWLAAEKRLRLLHDQDASTVTSQEARAGLSIKLSSAAGAASGQGLFKNDSVNVIKGEQKGLDGKIVGFDGSTVLIQTELFPEPLRVSRDDVVKTFKAGETVKVASGKYAGEAGAIVSVDGEFLTIFTDSTRKEIRVMSSHVADSADLNPGNSDALTQQSKVHYGTFDLVSLLQDNMKAVVVKVMDDSVRVIDTNNTISNVPFSGIKNKMKDQSARSHDARGNPIAPNDTITVISGPAKERSGVVLHVCGPNIFFRAQDEINNACGVIACLASSVNASTAAARRMKSSLGGGRSLAGPIPRGSISSLGRGGVMDPRGPRMSMGGGGPMSQRDPMMRQEVKIIKGEWKGYRGIVVYTDAKMVRVQLGSNMKTVRVAKDKVRQIDAEGNTSMNGGNSSTSNGGQIGANANGGYSSSQRPPMAPRTPRDNNYMQTPNPGSMSRRMATPAPDRAGGTYGFTPGPHTTPRSAYGLTPRSDAFRPTTPRHNSDPYASNHNPYDTGFGRSAATPMPMTPAGNDGPNPYARNLPQTPNTPGDTLGVGTPGPYAGGIVEPRTPANNLVPNTPAPFAGGVIEPRTPANMEPHTPGPMANEPQTPAPGMEPATPAPGLEPATPAPGLEPATPMPEPTTPHTPGVPQTPMPDEQEGANIGYKVLVDVIVSIQSHDSYSGVVRDASVDGSYVVVRMRAGPQKGQELTLRGHEITPVQPRSEIIPGNLEMVKVLDGNHQGKIGLLTEVRGDTADPDGVIHFNNGETGVLSLSFVAKCNDGEEVS